MKTNVENMPGFQRLFQPLEMAVKFFQVLTIATVYHFATKFGTPFGFEPLVLAVCAGIGFLSVSVFIEGVDVSEVDSRLGKRLVRTMSLTLGLAAITILWWINDAFLVKRLYSVFPALALVFALLLARPFSTYYRKITPDLDVEHFLRAQKIGIYRNLCILIINETAIALQNDWLWIVSIPISLIIGRIAILAAARIH